MAWGFGRFAPEASAGIGRESERIPILRKEKREALAPAPSPKKPPPFDSQRTVWAPRPWHIFAFTLTLDPQCVATRD